MFIVAMHLFCILLYHSTIVCCHYVHTRDPDHKTTTIMHSYYCEYCVTNLQHYDIVCTHQTKKKSSQQFHVKLLFSRQDQKGQYYYSPSLKFIVCPIAELELEDARAYGHARAFNNLLLRLHHVYACAPRSYVR